MQRLIVRRLVSAVPTLLVVTFLIYALLLLIPGRDPVNLLLGERSDPEIIKYYRKELRLDDPIPVQYVRWLGGVLVLNFGRSLRTNERVAVELGRRFIVTLELAAGSLLVALVIAVPIGIYSAARPNSLGDNVGTVVAVAGAALPSFWLGIMLIYMFAVNLGWLPTQGYVKFFEDPLDNLRHMLLPVIVNGTVSAASVARQTRSAMLEVLRQDYIRTARSKGLAEQLVLLRHALRNALIPVVTVLGLTTATLLGGTVITEWIFRLPGLGQFAVQSALVHDVPAIQGTLVVFGATVLVVNLVVDILYGFLDPRIRYT
ncbi:MAG: ABC transporter permease [Chloroflexi bacterium]|nr:ABC transporter permease [Chloroflexota bacterium]